MPEKESLAPDPKAEQSAYTETATVSKDARDFHREGILNSTRVLQLNLVTNVRPFICCMPLIPEH